MLGNNEEVGSDTRVSNQNHEETGVLCRCLVCRRSCCEQHGREEYDAFVSKSKKLIDPSGLCPDANKSNPNKFILHSIMRESTEVILNNQLFQSVLTLVQTEWNRDRLELQEGIFFSSLTPSVLSCWCRGQQSDKRFVGGEHETITGTNSMRDDTCCCCFCLALGCGLTAAATAESNKSSCDPLMTSTDIGCSGCVCLCEFALALFTCDEDGNTPLDLFFLSHPFEVHLYLDSIVGPLLLVGKRVLQINYAFAEHAWHSDHDDDDEDFELRRQKVKRDRCLCWTQQSERSFLSVASSAGTCAREDTFSRCVSHSKGGDFGGGIKCKGDNNVCQDAQPSSGCTSWPQLSPFQGTCGMSPVSMCTACALFNSIRQKGLALSQLLQMAATNFQSLDALFDIAGVNVDGTGAGGSFGGGRSALHFLSGDVSRARTLHQLLSKRGAGVNSLCERGGTPLHAAALAWPSTCACSFLTGREERADAEVAQPRSSVRQKYFYSCCDNASTVSLLCDFGADVDARDTKTGRTPLHWVSYLKPDTNVDCALRLLEEGADPNALDYEGNTPLDLAYAVCTRDDLFDFEDGEPTEEGMTIEENNVSKGAELIRLLKIWGGVQAKGGRGLSKVPEPFAARRPNNIFTAYREEHRQNQPEVHKRHDVPSAVVMPSPQLGFFGSDGSGDRIPNQVDNNVFEMTESAIRRRIINNALARFRANAETLFPEGSSNDEGSDC